MYLCVYYNHGIYTVKVDWLSSARVFSHCSMYFYLSHLPFPLVLTLQSHTRRVEDRVNH
jgi:hypothetical protein